MVFTAEQVFKNVVARAAGLRTVTRLIPHWYSGLGFTVLKL